MSNKLLPVMITKKEEIEFWHNLSSGSILDYFFNKTKEVRTC